MTGSSAPVSSARNSSPMDASALFIPGLHELVTIPGGQLEAVDGLQALDLRQRLLRKRRLPFQSVQRHPLQQIAKGNIQVFREALEYLYESLFHPRADLDSIDPFRLRRLRFLHVILLSQ